jgi:serine protease Do
LLRDDRPRQVMVKLAERNVRDPDAPSRSGTDSTRPDRSMEMRGPGDLGLTVIEIDAANSHRFDVPDGMTGLLVQRVEPLSPAHDAGIERGNVILQINRQDVDSVVRFRRVLETAGAGVPLALYIYIPDIDQRNIKTVRVDR